RALHTLLYHTRTPTATLPLSLHDALPICVSSIRAAGSPHVGTAVSSRFSAALAPADAHGRRDQHGNDERDAFSSHRVSWRGAGRDRKSTRLNSSHLGISYAVFCLKKKIH